ncbi:MAG TPA: Na+:solute symporter [Saprospiraceae bacterium]|nr:Na+:solute symporter [Saprospiraceae bacterium]
MLLNTLDWSILFAFFAVSIFIGIYTSRSNQSASDYFVGGGKMPWWLLGISMVATTFSTDTPNLVTDIVRQNGIAGNWSWWAFLLTGMLTVFVYARLWKKSKILTDNEFYEIRYSGKAATILRGFRAIYLGLFFNVMIMATVSLAAIKIGGVLLGLSPLQTILIAGTITVIYSSLGGLKGVLITDFIQFFMAIGGSILAAVYSLNHPKVGGLANLIANENVASKLDFTPSMNDPKQFAVLLLVPLLVQWWSVWYPGAEPGGGGYIVQRMFAAKDESNAVKSVLFFNVAHYALRPWPWIIVALCSIVVYPDIQSLKDAFPNAASIAKDDLAYSAMLTFLPHGVLGIIVTSLIAAYMSTISTHLNWGSSYLVLDVYKRFIKPESSEKELMNVGKISTVVLMILAMLIALVLENALQSFNILLQIGAGTGLLFILRWFWWRINASAEIAAMASSFTIAIILELLLPKMDILMSSETKLLIGVGTTTLVWILTALLTKPSDEDVLINFVKKVKPGGPGWKKVREIAVAKGIDVDLIEDKQWKIPYGIACMIFGVVLVYSFLFGTGHILFNNVSTGLIYLAVSAVSVLALSKYYPKVLD